MNHIFLCMFVIRFCCTKLQEQSVFEVKNADQLCRRDLTLCWYCWRTIQTHWGRPQWGRPQWVLPGYSGWLCLLTREIITRVSSRPRTMLFFTTGSHKPRFNSLSISATFWLFDRNLFSSPSLCILYFMCHFAVWINLACLRLDIFASSQTFLFEYYSFKNQVYYALFGHIWWALV